MEERDDDSGEAHLPATAQRGRLLRLDALKVLQLRVCELPVIQAARDGLMVALQAENLSWVCLVAVMVPHNLHAWIVQHQQCARFLRRKHRCMQQPF